MSYLDGHRMMNNSFWCAHRKYSRNFESILQSSNVYDSLMKLAGTIIEHLSDPVSAIGNMAMLANELL
jgi:hypothetical protein